MQLLQSSSANPYLKLDPRTKLFLLNVCQIGFSIWDAVFTLTAAFALVFYFTF